MDYLKGFFLLDLVSSVPFNLFISNSGSANKLLRILKIPRLIRMLKVAKVMQLKSLYKGTNFSYFLKINGGIIKVVSLALITILILHLFACVFSAIALNDTDDYLKSWIFRYGAVDFTDAEVYLTAYYFGMTTLTTVGYGDITPFTNCRLELMLR
jgi:Ion transport protein